MALPLKISALKATPVLWPAVAFVAGTLSSLAMGPHNLWPVLFLTVSSFYFLLTLCKSGRMGFATGWAFGFGYFVFGLSWIGNALLVEGNDYAWAWPLAVAGLPLLLAVFTGFAGFAAVRLCDLKTLVGYLGFSAALFLSEWLRGHLFTGFPWNLFGYAWADMLSMVQTVSVINVYGLTWLTILWAALPGFLFVGTTTRNTKIVTSAVLVSIFAASCGFGAWRVSHYSPVMRDDIRIRIVQPNIPQEDKWKREKMAENFFKHVRLSYPSDESEIPTYIVWPETAMSFWFSDDKTSMNILTQALQSYRGPAFLMTGLLRRTLETGAFHNSLVAFDKEGNMSNIYDKHHLVPFGEYIPYQKWIPLEPVARFSGFAGGEKPSTQTLGGLKYSPLICYEVIFPGAVINAGDETPDVMINLTNDSWYGDSAGPRQHLINASFRSVEEGIPLVRAANTGFSALVDPLGRLIYRSDLFNEEYKDVKIPEKITPLGKKIPFGGGLLVTLAFCIISYSYAMKRKRSF